MHIHKRARVQALLAFAIPGLGLAAVADTPRAADPQQMVMALAAFVVVVVGALAAIFVRWLTRAEQNVPRDPSRIAEALGSLRKDVERLSTDLRRIELKQVQAEARESERDHQAWLRRTNPRIPANEEWPGREAGRLSPRRLCHVRATRSARLRSRRFGPRSPH